MCSRSADRVAGSLHRLPTRPKQTGASKGATTQLHRARVLEVRIQSPPAVSLLRTDSAAGSKSRRLVCRSAFPRYERGHRGTGSSNPLPSSKESSANSVFDGRGLRKDVPVGRFRVRPSPRQVDLQTEPFDLAI